MSDEGRLIAGRYRLVEKIGRGGMGTVWRAQDELLDRQVAVKQLHVSPHLADDEVVTLHERTRREARSAARITHPNVVVVHDVVDEDGLPCIVMEYVPSTTLGDVLKEGAVSPQEAARIGRGMIAALRAAHAAGVLHRDVKPGNVLLGEDGRVVLTDFGIAVAHGTSTLTKTGEVIGSIDYIAPERVRGKKPGPASDLWALGATLYQAVEGRPPFRRDTAIETGYAIAVDPLDPPRQAGPLTPLIEALLAKEPDDRPPAEVVEQALRAPAAEAETALFAESWSRERTSGSATSSTSWSAQSPWPAQWDGTPAGATGLTGSRNLTGQQVSPEAAPGGTYAQDRPYDGADPYQPRDPHDVRESGLRSGGPPTGRTGEFRTGSGGYGPYDAYRGGPETGPGGPAGQDTAATRRRRGRTAVWSAVAVVVAAGLVAGGLYAMGYRPGSSDDGHTKGASGPTGRASQRPSGPPYEPPSPVPGGYHLVALPRLGVRVPVPDGWTPGKMPKGEANFVDPSGKVGLKIDVQPDQGESQLDHFQDVEQDLKAKVNAYQRLTMQSTKYRGYAAMNWEFVWQGQARQFRAVDLGFGPVGKRQYAIYLSAPSAAWSQYRPVFDNVRNSLRLIGAQRAAKG